MVIPRASNGNDEFPTEHTESVVEQVEIYETPETEEMDKRGKTFSQGIYIWEY